MTSLGETLIAARQAKGYTLDQATKETMIAKRYLLALESEDFSAFPAEAYTLGFLKNYSEYLSLDSAQMLSLYKMLKIQEQAVPFDALLHPPSQLPRILITAALILLIVGGAGAGLFMFFTRPKQEIAAVAQERKAREWTLPGSHPDRVYPGDTVVIMLGDAGATDGAAGGVEGAAPEAVYRILLESLSEVATLKTPAGAVVLDMSSTTEIDVNNDGTPDLFIVVNDIARESPEKNGADITFNLDEAALAGTVARQAESTEAFAGAPAPTSGAAQVLFSQERPAPMTLQAVFSGNCMFRWEILSEPARAGRNEVYFNRGDVQEIRANNGVRLWISNAGALKMTAIVGGRNVSVELGQGGEVVVVADVRWVIDEDRRYRLVLQRLET
jgi:cytoskeletal protein RodZ